MGRGDENYLRDGESGEEVGLEEDQLAQEQVGGKEKRSKKAKKKKKRKRKKSKSAGSDPESESSKERNGSSVGSDQDSATSNEKKSKSAASGLDCGTGGGGNNRSKYFAGRRGETDSEDDSDDEDFEGGSSIANIRKSLGFQDKKESDQVAFDDSASSSEEGDSGVVTSVADVKKSLGLAKRLDKDSEPAEVDLTEDDKSSLSETLKCVMCLSIMFKPVTMSCGHSFCRLCLVTAMERMTSDAFDRFRCPVCRRTACGKCCKRCCVNRTLWGAIQHLYPKLLKERGEQAEQREFERVFAICNGQTQSDDKSPGDVVRQESCKLFPGCTFSRFICSDLDDLVMHLALCLDRYPDPFPLGIRKGDASLLGEMDWEISVLLLELEEDEDAENCGFVAIMKDDDDDDNEYLIKKGCSRDLKLSIFVDDTKIEEISQGFRDGRCVFRPDTSRMVDKFQKLKLCFQMLDQEDLRMEILMDVTDKSEGRSYCEHALKPMQLSGDDGEPRDSINLDDSDNESEGSDLDEFENDGFIQGDDEDIIYESDASVSCDDENPKRDKKSKKKKKKKKKKKSKRKRVDSESEEEPPSPKKRKVVDSDEESDEVEVYSKKKVVTVADTPSGSDGSFSDAGADGRSPMRNPHAFFSDEDEQAKSKHKQTGKSRKKRTTKHFRPYPISNDSSGDDEKSEDGSMEVPVTDLIVDGDSEDSGEFYD
mmetsp:Transcript_23572/g.51225  ORF Transcript_23572/g.51225 Transcript_23572/m.51225 type:complete len:707 (-) Transcript_23572:2323-4443(-)